MNIRVTTILYIAIVCSGCGDGNRIDDRRGNDTRCDLHDLELQEGIVPIHNALPGRHAKQEMNTWKRFPYSNTYCVGGDVVSKDLPKNARVRFCPKCREAEATWEREYEGNGTTPITEYMIRLGTLLQKDDAFKNVFVSIHRDATRSVDFEGRIGSSTDLARLKRLAEEAKPPKPPVWEVKVIGS